MTNLDLYAKSEYLLGIQEATNELHDIFLEIIKHRNIQTLLDVGCGRGNFILKMKEFGIDCQGIDKSQMMVDACLAKGLHVSNKSLKDIDKKYDAIVAIFDVLNFFSKEKLINFLELVALKLNSSGIFIADINTLYGFNNVANGVMCNEDKDSFLNIEADFNNNTLTTKFTFFQKLKNDDYKKYQDKIIQYFHKIQLFQNLKDLKLIDKQTIDLYDKADKTLLILQKK